MGTTFVSNSMEGATMRVGGFSAGGGLVGVGGGVGVGGTGVAGGLVGVASSGVGVTVQFGSWSGVGPSVLGGWVGVAVGDAVGVSVAVAGRTRTVTAITTAPASVITGSGGWFTRAQMPQPSPARINTVPIINIPRDRVGSIFVMQVILSQRQCLVKPNCPMV
jgi:hypothetical protein